MPPLKREVAKICKFSPEGFCWCTDGKLGSGRNHASNPSVIDI